MLNASVNNLVRLDPETGEVEEFPIPFSFGIGNATIPGKATRQSLHESAIFCAHQSRVIAWVGRSKAGKGANSNSEIFATHIVQHANNFQVSTEQQEVLFKIALPSHVPSDPAPTEKSTQPTVCATSSSR